MVVTSSRSVTVLGATAAAAAHAAGGVVVVAPAVLAYVATIPKPHYHLIGDRHDPVALVIDVGLVLIVLFVGCKLVACRLIRG
jgi:hypothetical protein